MQVCFGREIATIKSESEFSRMMTAGRSQEMSMQCVMHNSLSDYINLQFTKNQPELEGG
jgi:hypothetical protein